MAQNTLKIGYNFNEKIAKLIYENVKKPMNEHFIRELVKIVVEEYWLDDFINENKIDILYMIEKLDFERQYKQSSYSKLLVSSSTYSKEYYYYLYVTRLVLKELELLNLKKRHVDNTIFNSIIRISLEQNEKLADRISQVREIDNFRNKQIKYYAFSPEERYSKIVSYNYIDEISTLLEEEYINKINMIELINAEIKPYLDVKNIRVKSKQKAPSLFYLEQIGCSSKDLKDISRVYKDYGAELKLKNGLDVEDRVIRDSLNFQDDLKRSLLLK